MAAPLQSSGVRAKRSDANDSKVNIPAAQLARRPLPQPPTPTLAGAAVGAAAAGDPILAGAAASAAAAGDPMMRSPRAARWRTAAAATRNRLPLRGRRATYDAAILRCCNRPAASAGAAPLMQFYCLSPSVGVRPRNCVPGAVGGRRRGRAGRHHVPVGERRAGGRAGRGGRATSFRDGRCESDAR